MDNHPSPFQQPQKDSKGDGESNNEFFMLLSADAVVTLSDEEARHHLNTPSKNIRNELIPVAVATRYDDDENYAFTITNLPPSHLSNDSYRRCAADEINRQLTSRGTRRGRHDAAKEVADIQWSNRTMVPAITNMHERNVDLANQNAAIRQRLEQQAGRMQNSATVTSTLREQTVAKPSTAAATEFYMGSYGAEYQTSDYATCDYTTTDYETTPYKSVYEYE